MPLPVNTIVLITVQGRYAQQKYMLTLTYRISATTSVNNAPTDTQDIALFFSTTGAGTFMTLYRACLPSDYEITEVKAQPIAPNRLVSASVAVAMPGQFVDVANTGNVAAAVTMTTQQAGRSEVANKHIGPIPTTQMTQGALVSGYRALLNALGGELIQVATVPAGANTITMLPVIFHRGTSIGSDIFGFKVTDRVGTMRRRTLRVGE